MKLADLPRVGRTPSVPLRIDWSDQHVVVDHWLRVLPGRRYVGRAEWNERTVLIKLLVGSGFARAFRQELEGAKTLAQAGIVTPQLLDSGCDAQGAWLIFDFLESAESLGHAWSEVADEPLLSSHQRAILTEALSVMAHMHLQGVWQADLHLDNLLRHQQQLYVVDGGGIEHEQLAHPLSRARVIENLSVFFAQLPAALTPWYSELLLSYCAANSAVTISASDLDDDIARIRRWRLKDWMSKVARDCSQFSVRHSHSGLTAVVRAQLAKLQPVLESPEDWMEQGKALKRGGTATVVETVVNEQRLVLKRYNIKSFGHWLTRFWRPSRAWHSWVQGHRLRFLGIDTPEPLAVIERRRAGLRGRSYLITEHGGNEDIIQRFAAYVDSSPSESDLQALDRLFAAFVREQVSHGDLKGHNILWQQNHWVLIDLDAAQQHSSPRRWRQAYARDRARFLRNWPSDSALYRLLDQRLPSVPV